MAKRVRKRGKFYRWRRGKLVQIPGRWVGETLHPQTKRKRQSKSSRKLRMQSGIWANQRSGHPRNWAPRHRLGRR
jgi:hypothetical protein